MSIFDEIGEDGLRRFVAEWSKLKQIDSARAIDEATRAIKYYKSNGADRTVMRPFQELENRWYDSLAKGAPDYSVYDDEYFLSDIWACWIIYSRKYLMTVNSKKSLVTKSILDDIGEVKKIVDLGCGFGYTTAGLKELFPNAEVYGTNLPNTTQWKLASVFGERYGFKMVPDVSHVGKAGLIFASEYFEHFESPVGHLSGILNVAEPRFLLIANTFGKRSIGHFSDDDLDLDYYKYENSTVKASLISRIFNKTLRASRYERVETKWKSQRPYYWKKK